MEISSADEFLAPVRIQPFNNLPRRGLEPLRISPPDPKSGDRPYVSSTFRGGLIRLDTAFMQEIACFNVTIGDQRAILKSWPGKRDLSPSTSNLTTHGR